MSSPAGLWSVMLRVALGAAALAALLAASSPAAAANAPSGELVYTGSDGIYVQRAGAPPQRIWKAPAGGSGTSARWSPGGSRIAFEGPDGNIWIMNADGSAAHAVTAQAVPASDCGEDGCVTPGTEADSPEWSPDGSTISYRIVDNLSNASIWAVSVSGGSPHQLASATGLCLFNEGFSPDGRPLYSRCATAASPSNATYSSATAGQSPFVAGSQVAFSADGSRVAYSNHALSGDDTSVGLFVSAPGGSGARLVAAGGQNPTWSRSGLLAYQVGTADGWVMHVYDPSTGKDTVAGNGLLGGWTPDGVYLYYTVVDTPGPTVWIVHPDGTGASQVATGRLPDWAA